jgi:transcription initiation factor TFIID TATA-box-binding protein
MDSSKCKVVNTIFTSTFNTHLDLAAISSRLANCRYNPRKFSGAVIRFTSPKVTILLFRTGRLVIAGAKNENAAEAALRYLVHIMAALQYKVEPEKIKLRNVVVSCSIGRQIDMYKLADNHKRKCLWVPELFTGATYKFNKDRSAVATIFASGKFNLTGTGSIKEVLENYAHIKEILASCSI